MIRTIFTFIPAVLILFLTAISVQAQQYRVEVTAGLFDRMDAVVSFQIPDAVEPGVYRMTSESGSPRYVQVSMEGEGEFILDHLAAGESRTYLLQTANTVESAGVVAEMDENTITFLSGDRQILSYIHGTNNPPEELDDRYKRGGYIHPLYSPDGVQLTNHLNAEVHAHHYGIWSAWTNTRFQGRTPDFWNVHLNSGRVDNVKGLDSYWDGPVHGGFRSRHYFTDLSSSTPVIALNEEWDVSVYRSPETGSYHMFDLKVSQSANSGQPLILPEYHYGGVGFRGHIDWDDPENATFLTSEGLGRDGHATRVRWTHIGGHSDGKLAGVAIFSHPDNFRHPQTVRIHPSEPFFNYAPTQLGEMTIEPGSPYIVRYRFVTYDGEPDPDQLNRMWNDFAYPPGVTVVRQE